MNNTDALSFNKNIDSYIIARPGYPNEMYEKINIIKNINCESKILELGCGNGIATKEIIDKWNPYIIGIEPGNELYEKLKINLVDNKKIHLENIVYEDYQSEECFDAIVSATSFHWMDKNIKYKKSYKLLKNNGVLILYWNYFANNNTEIEKIINELYIKYGFERKIKSNEEIQNDKMKERNIEIESSGLFTVIENSIMENVILYSVDRYIELLKTFPDHSVEKKPKINEMYDKIRIELSKYNNEIYMKIRTNLIIARRNLTTAST